MSAPTTWLPQEVDAVEVAFPTAVSHLMPPMAEIPDEFRRMNYPRDKGWNALVSSWFFVGLTKLDLTPNDGIDEARAVRHVRTIMRSFEPKHEHKEAACSYLMSLWFKRAEWTPQNGAHGSAESS